MATIGTQQWFAPAFESLRADLGASEVLRERYPEFVAADEEPVRSLIGFDFLVSIAQGMADERALAHWTMYGDKAPTFARRLHGDTRLRTAVAAALGKSLEDFDAQAPEAFTSAHALGQFGGDRSSITILQQEHD